MLAKYLQDSMQEEEQEEAEEEGEGKDKGLPQVYTKSRSFAVLPMRPTSRLR
jgi:hypothetical protein